MAKRKVQPVPPEGVRIERADGTVLPVELVYDGLIGGLHQWAVTGVVVNDGDAVCADVLPPQTSIALRIED